MQRFKETIYKLIFTALAFSSLVFLVGIIVVLFAQGIPFFREVNFFKFILGRNWYPTFSTPEYGVLPIIMASVWVTAGALVVCVPLGIGSALFIHELAGARQKAILKPMVEVLAAIPSIVFGFFGILVIAPAVQKMFNLPTGLCALSASVVLGIMAVPTISSIADDALSFVPRSFREASFALGANRWQTLTRIIIPAAGSGISTSIILGMSRIVGETMTVLMVAGGAAVMPHSFLNPVRPMTSTIAAEMGEAVVGSTHYNALFAIGLILFMITLVLNVFAEIIARRYRLKLGQGR